VSDHPTQSASAGASREREDHPTTELPPQPSADEQPADTSTSEAQTKAFAGFRTERRFSDAQTRGVPPPATRAEPRAWAATPHKGLPQVVDPPSSTYGGYYGGQPPGSEAHTAYRQASVSVHPSPSPYPELSTSTLLRQVKPPPSEGWRRWVYVLSGQLINVGESPRVTRYNDLTVQVNQPLRGCYRIALLSLKGGVGKTTITATLGATFASIRGDRVVAVDANPDRGTLSQKVPL
jgi:Mrp family chromosome partitioning ATPase